jgi:hypothetical protein
MTTYEQPPLGGWEEETLPLTWSPEDSPASRSPSPADSAVPLTSAGAGPGSATCYASYDPGTSSWRTSQLSFETPTPSDASSVTFTDSGSMHSGLLSQRAPLVHHTHVSGCSLWRTPVARDYKGYTSREGQSICNQLRKLHGGVGRPNPIWLAWLMGFPDGWFSMPSKVWETLSSPRSAK